MLINPKGSPLLIFRHYAAFSKIFFKKTFSKKIFKKFSNFFCFQSGKVIFQSYRAWKAHFGCLESVFKAFHDYILGIFRKLCAFWALDIAPTLDVPVLFFLFQPTISLWMVHFLQFVHLFCCSSSTKFLKPESGGSILALNHNIFMLPKVQQVRPKGPPFGFLSALCDFFSKIFGFYQRVTPCIFLKFSVCKNV